MFFPSGLAADFKLALAVVELRGGRWWNVYFQDKSNLKDTSSSNRKAYEQDV